jgi:hypothetical protein
VDLVQTALLTHIGLASWGLSRRSNALNFASPRAWSYRHGHPVANASAPALH